MLHVAVNAISLSDTFFKKLPRTHSAVAFSKTKPAALGFDLDVKAKISELKPPDKKKQDILMNVLFLFYNVFESK